MSKNFQALILRPTVSKQTTKTFYPKGAAQTRKSVASQLHRSVKEVADMAADWYDTSTYWASTAWPYEEQMPRAGAKACRRVTKRDVEAVVSQMSDAAVQEWVDARYDADQEAIGEGDDYLDEQEMLTAFADARLVLERLYCKVDKPAATR